MRRIMRTRNLSMTSILFLLFSSALGFADNTPPSNDDIQNWWKQNSKEKMTIEGKPVEIGLRNKEVAYLVPVGFYGRGRNFIWHTVMIRPSIRQVREVEEPVRVDNIVHDLNHDGISEIETVSLGSGQGTTHGAKSIVQFEGWDPIVLHQTEFSDNLGCCGPPMGGCGPCVSKEVNWKFVDLDGDGSDDLLEQIITKTGPSESKLRSKKTINGYIFKENVFMKLKQIGDKK
jgi:hypothetical protein